MDQLQFDDRLFQRGQTWHECLQAWLSERADFLNKVLEKNAMEKTIEKLRCLPRGTRIAVFYSLWTLDSAKSLPFIGPSLEKVPQLEVRYFSQELFFTITYGILGRQAPRILLLDEDGKIKRSWGPRPPKITEELQGLSASEVDERLLQYQEAQFLDALDHSVVESLFPAEEDRPQS